MSDHGILCECLNFFRQIQKMLGDIEKEFNIPTVSIKLNDVLL